MSMKTIAKALVAVCVATAVAASFFGAPTDVACRIQPAATITFLVVLLLTPLAGRLFCECLCPLGFLQSLVGLLRHPKAKVRRVCTRLPETRAQRIVRWTVFAAFAAMLATGYGAVAWCLTPYSIFGKALTLFAPGVVLFAAVLALSAFGKGRFWCNWVCPAGTLFALLSRKSLCAHKVGKGCAGCRACFGTGEGSAKAAGGEADGPGDGVTRRDALKGVAVLAAADAVEKTTDGGFAPVSLPGVPDRPVPVLPPGAADRSVFGLKCVACGLCVANCRGGCLSASTSLKRFGQPEMNFRKGWCLIGCKGACARACPTGAIAPIGNLDRRNVHMGHAIWRKDLCIRTTDGVECTACSRKCPVGAIHVVEGFPVVDKGKCIGCGACEHVCPARPMPAIFVKGFERQRLVWPFDETDLLREMESLVAGGMSCVAARDGVIVAKETGRGIGPILKMLDGGKLAHALVVDKVIGRAAAAVCIVGNAKKVRAMLMGADAAALLKAHGVECGAVQTVPKILNRDLSEGCPIDRVVEEMDDPGEMVKVLRKAAVP